MSSDVKGGKGSKKKRKSWKNGWEEKTGVKKKIEIRKEDQERHARKRSQKSEEEKVLFRKENKERMAKNREAKLEDIKADDWESKSSADSSYDEKRKIYMCTMRNIQLLVQNED